MCFTLVEMSNMGDMEKRDKTIVEVDTGATLRRQFPDIKRLIDIKTTYKSIYITSQQNMANRKYGIKKEGES